MTIGSIPPIFMTLYLIWSYEHQAWWRPWGSGYTKDLKEAGRYEYLEARDICFKANQYSNRIEEKMVAFEEVDTFVP